MHRVPTVGVIAASMCIAMPGVALAQEGTSTTPAPAPIPTDGVSTTPTVPAIPAPPPAGTSAAPRWPVAAPTRAVSWAGRLLVTATARAQPSPGGKAMRLVQPVAPLGAGPVWLQVRRVKVVGATRWVKVLLPVRPNGTTAWIRASNFAFRKIDLHVEIDLSSYSLSLFRHSTRLKRFTVAVGAELTPTPTGRFAIAEVIPTSTPGAFLGPVVLPLTSFSNVLNEYAGGNGRVAIHGTNLPTLIGTGASHGCIRMHNDDIRMLSKMIGAGTRVVIRQ